MKRIHAYKSDSGAVFEDRETAAQDEMRHYLQQVFSEVNTKDEHQLVETLIERRENIIRILSIDKPEVMKATEPNA